MRWSLTLQPQVQHRRGTDNVNADALSQMLSWDGDPTRQSERRKEGVIEEQRP